MLSIVGMVLWAVYYSNARLFANPDKELVKSSVFIGAWLGIVSFLSLSGLMAENSRVLYPILMFFSFIIPILFASSAWGAKIALSVPLAFLVGFHVFRLPINLILDVWVEQGFVPKAFSWLGINYDVMTGILALIFAPLANRYRWIAWTINIVGIAMFVRLFATPQAVMDPGFEYQWPFILANPIGIGGVVAGHIILTRALRYH